MRKLIGLFALLLISSEALSQQYSMTASQVRVTSINFYESGYYTSDYGKRFYLKRFPKSKTRYINHEINLSFLAPGYETRVNVNSYWYSAGDVLIWQDRNSLQVQSGWTDCYLNSSYGWEQPGNWNPGKYEVDFYIDKQKIATGSFEIYDDRIIGQNWELVIGDAKKVEEYLANSNYYLATGNNTLYLQTIKKLAQAYVDRGGSRFLSEDPQGALQDLDAAIHYDPQNYLAFSNRGNVHKFLGNKEAALADYNSAIRLKADDAGIYDSRGMIKLDLGDFEGALQDLNQAVKLVPVNPQYLEDRAFVRFALRDLNGTVEDLRKALERYKATGNTDGVKRTTENLQRLEKETKGGPPPQR